MTELRALKAVYCFFFPEVRRILREVQDALPDETFLVSTPAETIARSTYPLFDGGLPWKEYPNGAVDVDSQHEVVADRLRAAFRNEIEGLDGFPWFYPTAGSSEGLFHLLAKARTDGVRWIYVLEGDYEGYGIQAHNLGLGVHVVREEELDAPRPPGLWFMANPSARDGNWLGDGVLRSILAAGHRVVLDLSYLGSTAARRVDLSHPGIAAVAFSMSKPFGLFRYRIGWIFSRSEIPTMYATRWFKDMTRHLQGLAVIERLGFRTLPEKYRAYQEEACAALSNEVGARVLPSEVVLLATLPQSANPDPRLAPYLRGAHYRFCLTPYFEEILRRRAPHGPSLEPLLLHDVGAARESIADA